MEKFKLLDGNEIPKIGLGTWQSAKDEVYEAIIYAAEVGYRLIDTAYNYGNEDAVGRAIKDCGIDRKELFITTKLPAEVKTYAGAEEYFEKSMTALGLDYLDLYLIHAPWPWSDVGSDYSAGNAEVWQAMLNMKKKGLIKSVGVSNFNGEQIENLKRTSGELPSVNQIRFFIGNTQEGIFKYCKENGVLVEAYSPLATGKIAEVESVINMAKKYGVTFAALCLRYCVQRGTVPLPKSVTRERIAENFVSDFEISEGDMEILNGIKGLFPRPYRS